MRRLELSGRARLAIATIATIAMISAIAAVLVAEGPAAHGTRDAGTSGGLTADSAGQSEARDHAFDTVLHALPVGTTASGTVSSDGMSFTIRIGAPLSDDQIESLSALADAAAPGIDVRVVSSPSTSGSVALARKFGRRP